MGRQVTSIVLRLIDLNLICIMLKFLITSGLLIQTCLPTVTAHSWVEQVLYLDPQNVILGSVGFIRGYGKLADQSLIA